MFAIACEVAHYQVTLKVGFTLTRETAAADFGERQLTPSRSRARRRARPPNPAPSAARLGAAARRPSGAWASNPHVEVTYRVVPFDDREFAVEVSIPESLSATVSTFPTGACHGDCHG